MAFSYRLIAAAIALLPAVAMANHAHQALDPASANASVPALQYQSSFFSYRAAADDEATPDARWISANQEVSTNGHSMHNMSNMSAPKAESMQMNMQDGQESHQMGGH
jgi:hypothetical protein